jgi:hypothetical protein
MFGAVFVVVDPWIHSEIKRVALTSGTNHATRQKQAEQNGYRQRLEGYLSCQQRLALAVA